MSARGGQDAMLYRNMMTGVQSAGHDVLGGIGVDGEGVDGAAVGPPQLPSGERLPGPPPRLTVTDKERMLKEQKKAVKKAHKAAKKVSCSVYSEAPCLHLAFPAMPLRGCKNGDSPILTLATLMANAAMLDCCILLHFADCCLFFCPISK